MSTTALVSSEFLALCQGQVSLLVQGVGASLTIVYLTEEWLGGSTTNLVPIAAYPENAADVLRGMPFQFPVTTPSGGSGTDFVLDAAREKAKQVEPATLTPAAVKPVQGRAGLPKPEFHQAVQPFYHDNHPVGLLVMARQGQQWREADYGQLERVAYTLSAACVMEHRLQWLQRRFQQQELLQERQQDTLDNLIHQFRNPLTALRTFGKLLVRRLGPEDPNQRVAKGIVRESDRLQDLLKQINLTVDNYGLLPGSIAANPTEEDIIEGDWEPEPQGAVLLAASPLTGAPLELESCNVVEILAPLLDSFEAIAQEKGQQIQLRATPPLFSQPMIWPSSTAEARSALASAPEARGNVAALREVLSNLLDNGLKYGHPNGTVAITLAQSLPQWLTVAISDDGPGVPVADQAQLFQRHYRGVQASGEKPGSGLGLAIARSLVEQMGGTLDVFSPAEDWYPAPFDRPREEDRPGSAFVIQLPCVE
ncbi:MAG: HAMP domain-containing histidine kinase [Synechococcales cyanobacterium CRU_2_2]|nr:HAMP domain-containing histidine kinase [Synechococcales cyanobacterium CRU_2_2]